jgi:hypothetical protein
MKNYYLTDRTDRRELDIELFIDRVCEAVGEPKEKVLSISRKDRHISPRRLIMYYLMNRTKVLGNKLTLERVGSYFEGEIRQKKGGVAYMKQLGNKLKDHSSVLHSINKHIALRQSGDEKYNTFYEKVEIVFNQVAVKNRNENIEIIDEIKELFTTSKLIKFGRFIAKNYHCNDYLQEVLSFERQMKLLSIELDKSTFDNEPFESVEAIG